MRRSIPTTLFALAVALSLSGCASTDTPTLDRVTALEERVNDLETRNAALEKAVAEIPPPTPGAWIPTLWPSPTVGNRPFLIPTLEPVRLEIPFIDVQPSDPGDCVLPLPVPLRLDIR